MDLPLAVTEGDWLHDEVKRWAARQEKEGPKSE
jgi:hypothetical protein